MGNVESKIEVEYGSYESFQFATSNGEDVCTHVCPKCRKGMTILFGIESYAYVCTFCKEVETEGTET